MNINNIYLYYERFTSPQSPNTYKLSDKINYKALKTPFYLSHHFCISDVVGGLPMVFPFALAFSIPLFTL